MGIGTARSIMESLTGSLSAKQLSPEADLDGFMFGSPDLEIDRILICRQPGAKELQAAIDLPGSKLILTREGPFYSQPTQIDGRNQINWSKNLSVALTGSCLFAKKRALLDRPNVVGYRLAAQWDASFPSSMADALRDALGLTPAAGGAETSASYGTMTPMRLAGLIDLVKRKLGIRALRVTGQANMNVSKAAVLPGLPDCFSIARAISDPDIDTVIVGETCEWEGTPYIQDVMASGRNMAMILIGYADSQEPGMAAIGDFVRDRLPYAPISFLSGKSPQWI